MLHVIKIRGCKRCGGDLFLERDSDGVYISCLQCGAIYVSRHEESGKIPGAVPEPLHSQTH